jgi:peptide/nickel transport system permease protein
MATTLTNVSTTARDTPARRRTPWQNWRRHYALILGLIFVGSIVILALLGPLLAPYNPTKNDYSAAVQAPSAAHPFGTDKFGRDQLSRVLVGARIDLSVGIICTLFPLLIGVTVGCVAGYYGGKIDALFMRIVDIQVAFPFYVLLIAILAILGPGLINMYYALILTGWISFARLIRGEVLVAKKMEYVTAARALGCGAPRIIVRHLLPNIIGPAFVFAMSAVVLNILSGASLGFLGLGVQAPNPEWGVMIAESREYMTTAWWLPLFPGLAIALVGVAFSLLGDGLSGLLRRSQR